MSASIRKHLIYGLFGLLLGFSLNRIGFSDYGQLHQMFIFADKRLYLVFAGAVGLSIGFYLIFDRKQFARVRRIHPGTVPGGILFGLGWVLCGACPAVPLVQLGEGKLPALVTLIGMLLGTFAYRWLHTRYFNWDRGSCLE